MGSFEMLFEEIGIGLDLQERAVQIPGFKDSGYALAMEQAYECAEQLVERCRGLSEDPALLDEAADRFRRAHHETLQVVDAFARHRLEELDADSAAMFNRPEAVDSIKTFEVGIERGWPALDLLRHIISFFAKLDYAECAA